MDIQPGIVDRLPDSEAFLRHADQVATAARSVGIPVILVVVGFRPGFPEISPENKMFSTLKDSRPQLQNPQPAIAPTEADIVVTKRRVSAFAGSDLEVVLRARGIRHLVLGGIATSGVVLSTIREAADKDFRLTVCSDLCADFDAEVHSFLLEKIFPRQAEVLSSPGWLA